MKESTANPWWHHQSCGAEKRNQVKNSQLYFMDYWIWVEWEEWTKKVRREKHLSLSYLQYKMKFLIESER